MENLFKKMNLNQNINIYSSNQFLVERFCFNMMLYLTSLKKRKNRILIVISKPINNNSYIERFVFDLVNQNCLTKKIKLVYLETFILDEKEYTIDTKKLEKYINDSKVDFIFHSDYDCSLMNVLLDIRSIAIHIDYLPLNKIGVNDIIINTTNLFIKKEPAFTIHYLNQENNLDVEVLNDSELIKFKNENS
jgi:hypothetical protein